MTVILSLSLVVGVAGVLYLPHALVVHREVSTILLYHTSQERTGETPTILLQPSVQPHQDLDVFIHSVTSPQ